MSDTKQISLTPAQSYWLAERLKPGVDYMQFGDQYLFFLSEEQWAHWLPKLPPAEAESKPMLTYKEMDDGWIFQVGPDEK